MHSAWENRLEIKRHSSINSFRLEDLTCITFDYTRISCTEREREREGGLCVRHRRVDKEQAYVSPLSAGPCPHQLTERAAGQVNHRRMCIRGKKKEAKKKKRERRQRLVRVCTLSHTTPSGGLVGCVCLLHTDDYYLGYFFFFLSFFPKATSCSRYGKQRVASSGLRA